METTRKKQIFLSVLGLLFKILGCSAKGYKVNKNFKYKKRVHQTSWSPWHIFFLCNFVNSDINDFLTQKV